MQPIEKFDDKLREGKIRFEAEANLRTVTMLVEKNRYNETDDKVETYEETTTWTVPSATSLIGAISERITALENECRLLNDQKTFLETSILPNLNAAIDDATAAANEE